MWIIQKNRFNYAVERCRDKQQNNCSGEKTIILGGGKVEEGVNEPNFY